MSAAQRRRGHDCERAVAAWLRANGWPDARTTRSELGHDGHTAPGDVSFAPGVTLEAKDVKASSWPSWRAQAVAEARPGDVVAVVRRTRGNPDVGSWETHVRTEGCVRLTTGRDVAPHSGSECPRTGAFWCSMSFAEFADLVRLGD